MERLLNCGLRTVEVGSFVRPDRVPQMADTPQLLPSLPSLNAKVEGEPIHYPVLVPNMRGLEGLLALEEKEQSSRSGVPLTNEVAVFVSATEVCSRSMFQKRRCVNESPSPWQTTTLPLRRS